MELSPYVEALRHDLEVAAGAGTEDTKTTARLLTASLEAAVRLCLVDALSAMAAEVTAGSDLEVEIRMHGREPQVVIISPAAEPMAGPDDPAGDAGQDRTTARLTVRLPEPLKTQAEQRAALEGLSVNAWMVRAVDAALRPSRAARGPRRITGYARA